MVSKQFLSLILFLKKNPNEIKIRCKEEKNMKGVYRNYLFLFEKDKQ